MRYLFIIFFFLFSFFSCREKILNERIEFINNSEPSIGKIKYFVYSRNGNSYVTFSYIVDNTEYEGIDGNCDIDSKEAGSKFYNVKKGEKYLVFYKQDNPEKSIIRLDYPIKDSTDFKRYVKEFEQMRKEKQKER